MQSFRSTPAATAEQQNAVRLESNYFKGHAERMRYAEFRRQDLFVGSGVVEASCRALVGSRLKRSRDVLELSKVRMPLSPCRCAQLSNRFDDYWEDQAAA